MLRQIKELDAKLNLRYGKRRHYYYDRHHKKSKKEVTSADEIAGGKDSQEEKHHKKKKGKKSKSGSDSEDSAYDTDDYDKLEEEYRRHRGYSRYYDHDRFRDSHHDRVIQRAIDALDYGHRDHYPAWYEDKKWKDDAWLDFGHRDPKAKSKHEAKKD